MRVSDEMQQPDDSLVLVRFLISSANEQFDQAELQVCISGRACLCVSACGFGTRRKNAERAPRYLTGMPLNNPSAMKALRRAKRSAVCYKRAA